MNDFGDNAARSGIQNRLNKFRRKHTKMIWIVGLILLCVTAIGTLFLWKLPKIASPNSSTLEGAGPLTGTTGAVLPKLCDNFYTHSCILIDPKIYLHDLTATWANVWAKQQFFRQLSNILDSEVGNTSSQSWRDAQTLYKFCVNNKTNDEISWEPLHKFLSSLGDTQKLDKNSGKKIFRWENLVVDLRNEGFSEPGFIAVEVVPKKESHRIIVRPVPMNMVFVRTASKGHAHHATVGEFQSTCGFLYSSSNWNSKCFERLRSDILNFEEKLAQQVDEDGNAQAHILEKNEEQKMNITEMAKQFQNVSWRGLLNGFLLGKPNVTDDEIILVKQPKILKRVLELVNTTEETLQANYLMWKVMRSFRFYLPTGWAKRELFEIFYEARPQGEERPRWMGCVEDVFDTFPLTLRNEYRLKHSVPKITTKVEEIFQNIKAGFGDLLAKMRWVNDDDRKNEIRRIESITLRDLQLGTANETFPKPFELKANPVETLLELHKLKMERHYLGKSSDEMDRWLTKIDIAHVSPRYSKEMNELYIPPECLQEVFFNEEGPSYKNYGALGFLIAREIARGFKMDRIDRNYQKCVMEQLRHAILDWYEVHLLNGSYNLDKDIHEHLSFRAAYLAYEISMKRNQSPAHESRDTYNDRQNFWISAAQLLCGKFTEQAYNSFRVKILPTPNYRVNGAFSDFQDFHRDFNCSEGSPMHKKGFCFLG